MTEDDKPGTALIVYQAPKMGRPEIEINWPHMDFLCSIQCTELEIADFFKCSVDTLCRRCKDVHGVTFAEYHRQHASIGKRSLRRKQYQLAQEGNVTMLKWLGQQWLDQSERQDVAVEKKEHRNISIQWSIKTREGEKAISPDNLTDLFKKYLNK